MLRINNPLVGFDHKTRNTWVWLKTPRYCWIMLPSFNPKRKSWDAIYRQVPGTHWLFHCPTYFDSPIKARPDQSSSLQADLENSPQLATSSDSSFLATAAAISARREKKIVAAPELPSRSWRHSSDHLHRENANSFSASRRSTSNLSLSTRADHLSQHLSASYFWQKQEF